MNSRQDIAKRLAEQEKAAETMPAAITSALKDILCDLELAKFKAMEASDRIETQRTEIKELLALLEK